MKSWKRIREISMYLMKNKMYCFAHVHNQSALMEVPAEFNKQVRKNNCKIHIVY